MTSVETHDEPDEPPEPGEHVDEDDDATDDEGDGLVTDDSSGDCEFVEFDPSGRYARYAEVLGKGAMKTVYRAYDMVDCKEVAWNKARPPVECSDEQALAVKREVHILQGLQHQGILELFQSWADDATGDTNFITELCSTTLLQFRLKHKHISRKAMKNWGRQILRGLVHLHTQDPPIIHRDLKCENILVKCRSNTKLKIGDFGSATFLDETHHMHTLVGTPEFMAPEMFQEDYNELVDIYSFGMCMLELLTRECPYSECKSLGQIYKKVMKGVKPKALHKVTDMQALTFINRCLLPVTMRPSAIELLADPFLQCYGERQSCGQTIKASTSMPDLRAPTSKIRTKSLLSGRNEGLTTKTSKCSETTLSTDPRANVKGLQANTETKACRPSEAFCSKSPSFRRTYRVTGRIEDENTLRLKIRIQESSRSCDIDFPFDLRFDSPRSVAEEMVRTLDYSESDLATIIGLITEEIADLFPNMIGRLGIHSPIVNAKHLMKTDWSALSASDHSYTSCVLESEIKCDRPGERSDCYENSRKTGDMTCRKALDDDKHTMSFVIAAEIDSTATCFMGEDDFDTYESSKSSEIRGLRTLMASQHGDSGTENSITRSLCGSCHVEEAASESRELESTGFLEASSLPSHLSWNGPQTLNSCRDLTFSSPTANGNNGLYDEHDCLRWRNQSVLFGSRASSQVDIASKFKLPPTGIGILLGSPTEGGLRRFSPRVNAFT